MYLTLSLGLICFLIYPSYGSIEGDTPVFWKTSRVPVVMGEPVYELIFYLESPCGYITENNFHKSMVPEAKRRCIEAYESRFVQPLASFCPPSTTRLLKKQHRVVKRLAPLLIAGGVAIGGLVVGGWALGRTFSLGTRVDDLEFYRENSEIRMDEFEKKILGDIKGLEMDRKLIQAKFNELINTTLHLSTDFAEVRDKYISMTHFIASLESRYFKTLDIIRETERVYKQGKLNPEFFDLFFHSFPCNNSCLFQLGELLKCEMSSDRKKIYMQVALPIEDPANVIMEADTFKLLSDIDNKTCVLDYTGPKNVVVNRNNHTCVHKVNVDVTKGYIYAPKEMCISGNSSKAFLFNVTDCFSKGHVIPIQLKKYFGVNQIYCFGYNFTYENTSHVCPNRVFTLPFKSNFSINGVRFISYRGINKHIEDPLLIYAANLALNHKVNYENLSAIKDSDFSSLDTEPTTTVGRVKFYSRTVYCWFGVVLVVFTFVVLVFIYFYCKKNNKPNSNSCI